MKKQCILFKAVAFIAVISTTTYFMCVFACCVFLGAVSLLAETMATTVQVTTILPPQLLKRCQGLVADHRISVQAVILKCVQTVTNVLHLFSKVGRELIAVPCLAGNSG